VTRMGMPVSGVRRVARRGSCSIGMQVEVGEAESRVEGSHNPISPRPVAG
jgi:hypothetical protein